MTSAQLNEVLRPGGRRAIDSLQRALAMFFLVTCVQAQTPPPTPPSCLSTLDDDRRLFVERVLAGNAQTIEMMRQSGLGGSAIAPVLAARAQMIERLLGRNCAEWVEADRDAALARASPPAAPPPPPPPRPQPPLPQVSTLQMLQDELRRAEASKDAGEVARLRLLISTLGANGPREPGRPTPERSALALDMMRAQLAEAEREDDRPRAELLRSFIRMAESAPPPGAPSSRGYARLAPRHWAQARALRATKLAASTSAADLAQAERDLAESCPQLRAEESILDLPMRARPVWLTERVSISRCYGELAALKARAVAARGGGLDADLLESVQFATLTEAGSAMTQAAARSYARAQGAGSLLDNIDSTVNAMLPAGEQFVNKWGPMLGRLTDQQLPDLLRDLANVQQRTRPQVEALDKLLEQLQKSVPAYFDLRSPQPVSLESLQARFGIDSKLLQPDEAVVIWQVLPGARKGLVVAVSKERTAWAPMSLSGDEIAARVRRLRAQIDPCAYGTSQTADCHNPALSFDLRAAYELHQALLGQGAVRELLARPEIKTLLIVPSGPLTAFPPGMLVTAPHPESDNNAEAWQYRVKWLLKERALSVLPAVSALRSLRGVSSSGGDGSPPRREGQTGRLFMFADPDYAGQGQRSERGCRLERGAVPMRSGFYYRDARIDRLAIAGLARLPCTRVEGDALLKVLGGTLITGADARESRLRTPQHRAQLAAAEVVAFATHGLVAGDHGLGEPALALAAPLASESGDDGVLTASEAAQMKLSADLVLLSACNTASPDANDAEGLSGLSRAFLFAGARAVLVSHWRVVDVASALVVTDTVNRRRAGERKAEALRKASLALMQGSLQNMDEQFRLRAGHPSYWAAFTLMGDPL